MALRSLHLLQAPAGPKTTATIAAQQSNDEAELPVNLRAAEHKAADKRHWQPRYIQEGDFVVVKVH